MLRIHGGTTCLGWGSVKGSVCVCGCLCVGVYLLLTCNQHVVGIQTKSKLTSCD